MTLSGSGSITARDMTVKELKLEISGSGTVTPTGKAQKMTAAISGSGSVKAAGLETDSASISIAGSGAADVWATKELEIDISGSGNIRYKGQPVIKSQSISGSGRVEQLK